MRDNDAVSGNGYRVHAKRVKDLPVRQQPRELVDLQGAEHVPDDVLLAIILRTGMPQKNVLELSRELMAKYGSLTEMAKASVSDLRQFESMGPVKAQVVKCALELARRLAQEQMPVRQEVRTPEDAVRVLREAARGEEVEKFWVLLLDTKYRMIRTPWEISKGILDASLVHPREVFKEAIRTNSAAVLLVHNHPSGDPTPSSEDIHSTRRLIEAGKVVDINVLDHVILGQVSADHPDGFCSLRETGIVTFNV